MSTISYTFKIKNGRLQRPDLPTPRNLAEVKDRENKLSAFEAMTKDLARVKNTALNIQALDNVNIERREIEEVSYRPGRGFYSRPEKTVEKKIIEASKDELSEKGAVYSKENPLGVEAFLRYEPASFSANEADDLALPVGLQTMGQNWSQPSSSLAAWVDHVAVSEKTDSGQQEYKLIDDISRQRISSSVREVDRIRRAEKSLLFDFSRNTVSYTVKEGTRDVSVPKQILYPPDGPVW